MRPIDPEWHCNKSGDCCRMVDTVITTEPERDVIMAFAERTLTIGQLNRINWGPGPRPGFLSLLAKPCPFLEGHDCNIYEVRPYSCRRFGCMRPDPKVEPLVLVPPDRTKMFGLEGCVNVRERLLQSKVARKMYLLIQRKAQRWGRKHGWSDRDS